MSKPAKRVRRPRTSTTRAGAQPPADTTALTAHPTSRSARDTRPFLARIFDTPHLARVVPRLQPEVLHRMIDRAGLEDAGELIALATPAQLTGVFDLDLWHRDQPGRDEHFDADRFGVWLEVLAESGADIAARTLAGVDLGIVTTAFAQHIAVFDPATVHNPGDTEGDDAGFDEEANKAMSADIGGYLVVAKRADSWDAIVAVLLALDAAHHRAFHTVMHGCRSLSNSTPEVDGLDNLLTEPEQVMFNLATDRERRRERQGYATPAEARAFLDLARHVPVGRDSTPPRSAIADAYFRAVDDTTETSPPLDVDHQLHAHDSDTATNEAPAVASLVDILVDEGVLPRPPRALLGDADGPTARLARIQMLLQFIHDSDPAAYLMRTQELAFLANAMLAGCSVQARPLTLQEASDAAVAVCNLGLENWPAHWSQDGSRGGTSDGDTATLSDSFLAAHDLVVVFQVGWRTLYGQVCMFTAEQLIAVLRKVRCDDRETQAGVVALRKAMAREWKAGTPWRARDALDVITSLDMPAWAALLGLIDQCPVMHAGLGASRGGTRAVSPSDFQFISDNSQIALVRAFMQSLPDVLRG
jgi:hypothetical protein